MGKIKKPIIIDIEASGFSSDSYPIEVGLAMANDEKYCSLILPKEDWTHWDQEAERVHRVSRDILETYGKPIHEVTHKLNELLAGKTIYSDGWVVDQPWLIKLFHAAGREMQFRISPLELILSETQMEKWHATKDQLEKDLKLARHRASIDAWLIQKTYQETL